MKIEKTFWILIAVVLAVACIPSAFAWEFDNVKSYDTQTKTITLSNSIIGFPTTKIADVQLLSEQNVYVIPGENRLVAEFKINLTSDNYDGFIKQIDLYNIKNANNKISRNIHFEQYVNTGMTKEVIDYEQKCVDSTKNETGKVVKLCNYVKIGTHKEDIYEWKSIDTSTLTKGEYTIGIYADVKEGDYVEWQPTLAGVKVTEWATWQDSFNVGLKGYYNYSETTGDLIDIHDFDRNMTVLGSPTRGQGGKIGLTYDKDGANDKNTYTDYGLEFGNTGSYSFSIWINNTETVGDPNYFFMLGDAANPSRGFYIDPASGLITYRDAGGSGTAAADSIGTNKYYHVVGVFNGTTMLVYINNTLEITRVENSPIAANPNVMDGWIDDLYIWKGQTDELAIWNRTLTALEITDLYNNGAGITYTTTAPASMTVDLSYPANSTNFSVQTINFGCNATGSASTNVTSIILNVTGNVNWTQTITGINQPSYNATFTNTTVLDGNYVWNCIAYGDTANSTSLNRSFLVDLTKPYFIINKPTGNTTTFSMPINISLNVTTVDVNPDNCAYITSENTTPTFYTCSTEQNVSFSNSGIYNITVYANDTLDNQNSTFISYFINYVQPVMNITTPIIEGESYIVYFNITANSIYQTNATVSYNNTNYVMDLISNNGTKAIFSKTLISPFVTGNTVIPVNITYYINGDKETITLNQTVFDIPKLSVVAGEGCSGNQSYIFNTKDEINFNSLISDWTYNLYYGGTNSTIVNTQGNISGTNNISICYNATIAPSFVIGSGQIGYTSSGYSSRVYYFGEGANLTIPATNITLYLLNSTGSTDLVAKILNSNLVAQKNINVQLLRYYPSTNLWINVAEDVSDELGQTVFNVVEKTVNYKFVLSSEGNIIYTTDTVKIVCYAVPCQIELTIPSTGSDLTKYYTNRSGVSYALSYNNNTQTASIVYSSIDGTPKTIQLLVNQLNISSNRTICNNFSTGLAGEIDCNLSLYSGTFFAQAYVNTTSGMNILDRVSISIANFFKTTGTEGLLYAAFFIIILVFVGIWNPTVSIGLMICGFLLLSITGIISVGWAALISIVILGGYIIYQLKS